jgi:pentatricopeptide repeat protein
MHLRFVAMLLVSCFDHATFSSIPKFAKLNQYYFAQLSHLNATSLPNLSNLRQKSSLHLPDHTNLYPIKELRLKGGNTENVLNLSKNKPEGLQNDPATRAVENIERIRRSGRRLTIEDFNDAIRECWRGGRWDLSLDMYGALEKECLKPNRVTFNAVLGACARGGQHDMAEKIFSDMSAKNINADDITYNAMIISFAR